MLKNIYPPGSDNIRLNQVGFYPSSPKYAIVLDSLGENFAVFHADDHKEAFSGILGEPQYWEYSGERVRLADFSSLKDQGTYYIKVGETERSHYFEIKDNVLEDVHKSSLKSFYYQRASSELDKSVAGIWARGMGHPDSKVKIHRSVESPERKSGSLVSAPGGWYDAGDYGKYTANAAYATWIMLHFYEQFPQQLKTLNYQLPESSNKIPDVLDEALYSLRWIMAMQDPESGKVYHKLTGLRHPPNKMPEDDKAERYMIGESTGTTYAFAALMAKANRIFKDFEKELPGLADSCLTFSLAAWKWAEENPNMYFQNPPDIHTGQYKDGNYGDEYIWAKTEIYLSNLDDQFKPLKLEFLKYQYKAPGWNATLPLAWMSMGISQDSDKALKNEANAYFQVIADAYLKEREKNPYQFVLGRDKYDFIWGSNGIAASAGMSLIHAYTITKKGPYKEAAQDVMDYLLGRNATGYSFLTGAGTIRPMNIHHRPSNADGIDEPIPGFLVGGPQGEKNYDGCTYPSSFPAAFYVDDWCSYSTNEVCLNWNAPFVYLSGALEFLQ
ncbi:MAG: glycoside hydrolase family 9 protein [Bacteroidota bacterium]